LIEHGTEFQKMEEAPGGRGGADPRVRRSGPPASRRIERQTTLPYLIPVAVPESSFTTTGAVC
jgi:hypothetical protein